MKSKLLATLAATLVVAGSLAASAQAAVTQTIVSGATTTAGTVATSLCTNPVAFQPAVNELNANNNNGLGPLTDAGSYYTGLPAGSPFPETSTSCAPETVSGQDPTTPDVLSTPGQPDPPQWTGSVPSASWVGIELTPTNGSDANNPPAAYYIYDATFTLCANQVKGSTTAGTMLADNAAGAYLNGVLLADQTNPNTAANFTGSGTTWSGLSGGLQAGLNTLQFVVLDYSPSYTGLDFSVTVTSPVACATGTLKVCKVAGTNTATGVTVPVDTDYSFTANGGAPFSVPAGPAPGGYCVVVPGTFDVGTNVTLQEVVSAGNEVSAISVAPAGALVSSNPGSPAVGPPGQAVVTIGAGVTEVTYTDVMVPTGYVEVCKVLQNATASQSNATFQFTVSGGGGTVSVPAGACSPAIQVTAGTVTITEQLPCPSTTLAAAAAAGATTIQVACDTSRMVGQSITIDTGASQETRTITAIAGSTITLSSPLAFVHASGVTVTDGAVGSYALIGCTILPAAAGGCNVVTMTATVTVPAGGVGNEVITTFTDVPTTGTGTASQQVAVYGSVVPGTLSLAVDESSLDLGTFAPGVAATYSVTLDASVTATGSGGVTLAAADPSTTDPGYLINGKAALSSPLELDATDAANQQGAFAPLGATPISLLSYPGAVSNDSVTIGLQQAIGSSEPLSPGLYGKTVTFTLSAGSP